MCKDAQLGNEKYWGQEQQAVGHVQSMVSEDGHSGGQEQWDSLLTTWQTEV